MLANALTNIGANKNQGKGIAFAIASGLGYRFDCHKG
jgi:hypothetical protein